MLFLLYQKTASQLSRFLWYLGAVLIPIQLYHIWRMRPESHWSSLLCGQVPELLGHTSLVGTPLEVLRAADPLQSPYALVQRSAASKGFGSVPHTSAFPEGHYHYIIFGVVSEARSSIFHSLFRQRMLRGTLSNPCSARHTSQRYQP